MAWTAPAAEAPDPGWIRRLTAEAVPYWFNTITGAASLEAPAAFRDDAAPNQPPPRAPPAPPPTAAPALPPAPPAAEASTLLDAALRAAAAAEAAGDPRGAEFAQRATALAEQRRMAQSLLASLNQLRNV